MKQTHTLKPDHTLTFNAGQSGKFLILRETTHSLILQGDTLRPVEIFGGDTVDVSALDKLELHNHQPVDVTFEYQVSDLRIMTKAQKINVSNAMLVSEIETPIHVRKVIDPVKVSDIVTPLKVSEIQTPISTKCCFRYSIHIDLKQRQIDWVRLRLFSLRLRQSQFYER